MDLNKVHPIDYYIEKSKKMKYGDYDGIATVAFDFEEDNVALIKYSGRTHEEEVMQEANRLNALGVHTPLHLDVKRETINGKEVIWSLQERAKGKVFTKYSYCDTKTKLKNQAIIANAPLSHFEKYVLDNFSLSHMGVETDKAKNIFYDVEYGFSIIDLLCVDPPPIAIESSIAWGFASAILDPIFYCCSFNSDELEELTDIEKAQVTNNNFEIRKKCFLALKNTLGNFKSEGIWILRNYNYETLNYFIKEKVTTKKELSLSKEEYNEFYKTLISIVNENVERLVNGSSCNFSEYSVCENERLFIAWEYHKDNPLRLNDFKKGFDYTLASRKMLVNIVRRIIYNKVKSIFESNTNKGTKFYFKELEEEILEPESEEIPKVILRKFNFVMTVNNFIKRSKKI